MRKMRHNNKQWGPKDWAIEDILVAAEVKTSGCWNWNRSKRVQSRGAARSVTRILYKHFVGDEVPDGYFLNALCGNRECCNPFHRKPMAPSEALALKAGNKTGMWSTKTHCKNGHEFTPENTVWQKDIRKAGGLSRFCRECRNQRFRDRRHMLRGGLKEYGIAKTYRPTKPRKARVIARPWDISRMREKCTEDLNGCWAWPRLTSKGYAMRGSFGGDKIEAAYQATYRMSKGPIPAGLHIDHLCRNKACCNPTHLEAVTQQENNRRKIPRNKCRIGHSFTEENTLIVSRGKRIVRQCRICSTDGRYKKPQRKH